MYCILHFRPVNTRGNKINNNFGYGTWVPYIPTPFEFTSVVPDLEMYFCY
jgi:hypothetical protein